MTEETAAATVPGEIRAELQAITKRTAAMSFVVAQRRFGKLLAELRHDLRIAVPGEEWDGTEPLAFELALLARQLGFQTAPVTFDRREQGRVDVDVAIVNSPRGDSHLTIPIATYDQPLESPQGEHRSMNPATRRVVTLALQRWGVAVRGCASHDYRKDQALPRLDEQSWELAYGRSVRRFFHAVRIGPPDDAVHRISIGPVPHVEVDGKKKKLDVTQWEVLNALARARSRGLTENELVTKSGRGDARDALARLKADPDLGSRIRAAGHSATRYRIE
jgi:hypothetical protein